MEGGIALIILSIEIVLVIEQEELTLRIEELIFPIVEGIVIPLVM